MIKLLKILSEIKVRGKITSKDILKIYDEILNIDLNSYEELYSIKRKYFGRSGADIEREINDDKNLDQNKLINLYQDLLTLKNKYNVQEIKVTPKINWKNIIDIREKIRELVWDKPNDELSNEYKKLNQLIFGRRIEKISQEELIEIYHKFLNLYNKYK